MVNWSQYKPKRVWERNDHQVCYVFNVACMWLFSITSTLVCPTVKAPLWIF